MTKKKYGVWRFNPSSDDSPRGWWCLDVPEYYIAIGTGPDNDPCRDDDPAPRSYAIVRDGGESEYACPKRFKTLASAKKDSAKRLYKMLQKSATIVWRAWSKDKKMVRR